MQVGTYILVITLNVNGVNTPNKGHRLVKWTHTKKTHIFLLQDTHFRPRDTNRLKARGWERIFHANENQKKTGVAFLISGKTDLKMKNITRDKDGYYIMIKRNQSEKEI